MKVLILIGPSGSGRSYWCAQQPKVHSVSANNYFETDQGYVWDPAKLDAAHGSCIRGFNELIQTPLVESLAVDNVNCQLWEIIPYVSFARAYGHEVELHVFMSGNPEFFAARNIHDVPLASVTRQWHSVQNMLENGLGLGWDTIQDMLVGADRSGKGARLPRTFRPFNLPVYFH